MRSIGYSTGAIAYGDFRRAVALLAPTHASAIELSALREEELQPLCEAIDRLDLSKYSYTSLHAPTKLARLNEKELVDALLSLCHPDWPIIVHPNVITDYKLWRVLGANLCIENMDKRQQMGRTSEELAVIFDRLPEATLCFDIGHARQVDPTMTVAAEILQHHSPKIRQLHVSEVDTRSKHRAITFAGVLAFQKVIARIPDNAPIIIESVIPEDAIERELNLVEKLFQYPLIPLLSD